MNDAITVFFYVFNKIYNFLFNEALIEPGVSVGWIFVTVVIFGILIRTILNVPTGLHYGDHYVYKDGGYTTERGFYKGK